MRRAWWCVPACLIAGCSPGADLNLNMPPPDPVTVVPSGTSAQTPGDPTHLLSAAPLQFLERCLGRVEREVHGYRATLIKQERLNGKLGAEEEIAVHFRERPFSVLMEWKRGHKLARKTLFVDGAHDNKIVVQPAGWRAMVGQVTCPVDDADARATSRFPISEFGMAMGTRRTLATWKAARERGELCVTFQGVRKIAELGDRECWVVHRADVPGRDPDGITDSTYLFDPATWLQVGTVLRDDKGQLVGRYHFRDVEINPTFDETTFCRERLKR
jgi:hypothetical protein